MDKINKYVNNLTDISKLNLLNDLLIVQSEQFLPNDDDPRDLVVSIVDSDVIRPGTDWCSSEDWDNDVYIGIYKLMVGLIELLPGVEYINGEYK